MRDLYHGIIQVGVGLYHRQRGNQHGAIALTRRGIRRLQSVAPVCHGVDVDRLIKDASAVLRELEILGTTRGATAPSPVIRWRADRDS